MSEGKSLIELPLSERREKLEELLSKSFGKAGVRFGCRRRLAISRPRGIG